MLTIYRTVGETGIERLTGLLNALGTERVLALAEMAPDTFSISEFTPILRDAMRAQIDVDGAAPKRNRVAL